MKSIGHPSVFKKQLRVFCFIIAASILVVNCEESPEAPPPDDEVTCDNLLTDGELLTDPDPGPIPVDSVVSAWIQANNYPIRSLTEECYSDLEFLKTLIGDRRLVQLGESGHGVSEFDAVKVRLIKFLHEEMGFDVIAFESSIFECYLANYYPDSLSAEDMMYGSIFSVWQCHEVLSLFEYIKETQATSRPLILGGFDIQISSMIGVLPRPAFMRDVVAHINPAYAQTVFSIDSTVVAGYTQTSYESFYNWVLANRRSYTTYYNSMVSFFNSNMDSLCTIYADDPTVPRIARQTAWSMPRFLQVVMSYPPTMHPNNTNQTMSVRDAAMAVNVGALMDKIYPDKKIINWGHNYHIRHDSRTMGEALIAKYRSDLYTVGLYMYRGLAAENDRSTYWIEPPSPNSIESVFYRTRRKYCFVDLLHQQQEAGNSWMFNSFLAKTWGQTDVNMIPRDEYDAILFIDTVKPPDYLPRITTVTRD
jgi:erythromycin esterase